MKKIILFLLLLCTASFAQITVVGDTTDLKNIKESGVVLLEQFGKGNTSGGGFFHRIDSTYTEGRDAFDYYVAGYQWARIGYVEYGSMFLNSQDTVTIVTYSTYYTIGTIKQINDSTTLDFNMNSGYTDGVTITDSSATLISDAYYDFNAHFSFYAKDSILYSIALFKNDVIDTTIHVFVEYFDSLDTDSTLTQNISFGGVVYSDGNDVFKIKIAAIETSITNEKFIIRKANIRYRKIN